MTSDTATPRQPDGSPAGDQFAGIARVEPDVGLHLGLDDRTHRLIAKRADLAIVREHAQTRSVAPQDNAQWQALGYVLDAVLHAVDEDLGFAHTYRRWTAPPAHVLDMLSALVTAQYRQELQAHADAPLLLVAPWDRVRKVLNTLRARDGALDVDHLTG